ncbi:cap-specific mRNA (nucleoside-2'-O-)-methyltransferase 2-like isoform X2 [Lycorma delicatula]|uniref:cap-specific mRNA (nucleoside-2'-O-)-methyltransferase 2-like isoform X2 n=1 Tax=Lycorma delicatula TaxID=130591 RepID=UPI003F51A623
MESKPINGPAQLFKNSINGSGINIQRKKSLGLKEIESEPLKRKKYIIAHDEQAVDKYFLKIFEFTDYSGQLPQKSKFFTEEKWKVEGLQDLKVHLNETKSLLDDYNLNSWHQHTKKVNVAAEVMRHVRKNIKPDMLTQAWLKFYEIVASKIFDLIPTQAKENKFLNSVHLCEAPGAFITSLNHYLQLNYPDVKWDWLASTLNPHHEQNTLSCMINDDRLIYNTLHKWNFGDDATGDLFNKKNMEFLVESTKETFNDEVLLVTADGSIDCQSSPGEQESMVCPLLYAEVITAVHILKPEGSFLIKMFTLLECETVCLLYLLCKLFHQVKVFKPVTSKEGNSEVYVVCLRFRPPKDFQDVLNVLRSNYGSDITNKAMFGLETISEEFLRELKKCASFFVKYQEHAILSNIRLYKKMSDFEREELESLQKTIVKEYVSRYKLKKLPSYMNHVVDSSDLIAKGLGLNVDGKFDEGSFNDKLNKPNLEMNVMLEMIKKSLDLVKHEWTFDYKIVWIDFSDELPSTSGIQVGLPVSVVNNSKFCSGYLLKKYNEVVELLGPLNEKSMDKCSQLLLKICDVSLQPWPSNTWFAQKESVELIINELSNMDDNSSLLLVCFINPECSEGYRLHFTLFKKRIFLLMRHFLELIKKYNFNSKKAILAILPIQTLCDNRYFYELVVSSNHAYIKYVINEKLNQALKSEKVLYPVIDLLRRVHKLKLLNSSSEIYDFEM